MNKKAMAFISAILMVIVVVAGAYVVYQGFLKPDAPSSLFTDLANKYKYREVSSGLDAIGKDITAIMDLADEGECEEKTEIAINALAQEGSKLPADAVSMHTKISRMRAEAEANMHFCKGRVRFENAKFDGVNVGFLNPAKEMFGLVKGRKEFKSIDLAQQYIKKISDIESCKDYVCESGETKGFCVNFSIGKTKYCKQAVCLSANAFSQKGDERKIYCDAIQFQKGYCYTLLDVNRQFQGCYPCAGIKSCLDYKYNKDACVGIVKNDNKDACNIGPCEFPLLTGATGVDEGPCRSAGTGIMCDDHQDKKSCEADYTNKCLWVLGPYYQPYTQYQVYGQHYRCIDCAQIETCENYGIMDPVILSGNTKAFDFCLKDGCYQKYKNELGRQLLTCKSGLMRTPAGTSNMLECVSKPETCGSFHNNREQCLSKDYCYFVPGSLTGEFSIANAGPGAGECRDCSQLGSCDELTKAGACGTCTKNTQLRCVEVQKSDIDSTKICVDCRFDARICKFATSKFACESMGVNIESVCGPGTQSYIDEPGIGEDGGSW